MLTRTDRGPRRRSWLLLAVGLVAIVGGGVPTLVAAAGQHDRLRQRDVGTVPAADVAQVRPGGPTDALAAGAPAAVGAPPVRLRLPRLGVDAPVRPVSVGADGLLAVPANPRQVGWWSASARPGASSGSIVIAGHVDSATLGLGALFGLRQARAGDPVTLVDASGATTRYTVAARRSYPKTALPAAEVFALDGRPRLVIVTCGGRFDQTTRHYDDNIVVYAVAP